MSKGPLRLAELDFVTAILSSVGLLKEGEGEGTVGTGWDRGRRGRSVWGRTDEHRQESWKGNTAPGERRPPHSHRPVGEERARLVMAAVEVESFTGRHHWLVWSSETGALLQIFSTPGYEAALTWNPESEEATLVTGGGHGDPLEGRDPFSGRLRWRREDIALPAEGEPRRGVANGEAAILVEGRSRRRWCVAAATGLSVDPGDFEADDLRTTNERIPPLKLFGALDPFGVAERVISSEIEDAGETQTSPPGLARPLAEDVAARGVAEVLP